jgi:putative hydrolase
MHRFTKGNDGFPAAAYDAGPKGCNIRVEVWMPPTKRNMRRKDRTNLQNLYSIEADMHCHTLASTHAYSTVAEMAEYASKKGLKAFAVTDHGPSMPDSPHLWHFEGLNSLPDFCGGVHVFSGAEADIMDFQASLDLPQGCLQKLDWVVASFHEPCCPHGTEEQHTQAYLALADNPYVSVIGHSAGENYRYDYEKVLPVFRDRHKLVEINNNQASTENCRKLALLCKKLGVPVVVSSDAHCCYHMGRVQEALGLLASIEFPPGLIINGTMAVLKDWMLRRERPL